MADSDNGHEPSIMAAVNRVIDDLHRSLCLPDSEFFCECGHVCCTERITLTRAEYASTRKAARPVLAALHAGRDARDLSQATLSVRDL